MYLYRLLLLYIMMLLAQHNIYYHAYMYMYGKAPDIWLSLVISSNLQ